MIYVFLIGCGLKFLCCKFIWADCCTVVQVLRSAVDFCAYFVYLSCADGHFIVLCNLRSAVCVFVRLCFDSSIHYFAHFFLLFPFENVNTITVVILFCFIIWLDNCITVSHKSPLSGARRLKWRRAVFVTNLCSLLKSETNECWTESS